MIQTRILISLFLITGLLFAGLVNPAEAQRTGMQFLNIGPNAQSLSISEAHTAVPMGSNSIFSNPANLALEEQSSLGASYTFWIGDTQHTQASALLRSDNHAFAFGVLSAAIDDITVRTTPGPPQGSFSVRYLALNAAYARKIGFISVGLSGSYLYEQFFQNDASGFAFSAGLTTQFLDERLRLGTSVNHMGEMGTLDFESTPLPTVWRTGFDVNAVQLSAFGGSEVPVVINLSGDLVVPLNEELRSNDESLIESGEYLAFGLDAKLYDMVSVRAGYRTGNTVRNWSFGAGINVDPVSVHYAFVPFETGFGMVHSISMQYFFDF